MNDFNDEFLPADDQPVSFFELFKDGLVPPNNQFTPAKKNEITELQFSTLEKLLHLAASANPKIQEFFNRLKKIEENQDMKHLDAEISYQLHRSLKALLKRNLVISVVHSLLKTKFSNIAEFYCRVLSIFMLNTPLPKNLNMCLRNGNFSENDILILPYLVCLCKAFLCPTLGLNKTDENGEPQSIDLYQVIETEEEATFYRRKKIDERIAMKEFALFKTSLPLTGERRKRVCLHIEIPVNIIKKLKHSIYFELSRNRILFVRESNRAILAPGCDLIVSGNSYDQELEATMIKLNVVYRAEQKISWE